MSSALTPSSIRNRRIFLEFSSPDVVHGVFTRRGGVSPRPWDSLNVSFGVADEEGNVRENRTRLKAGLGLPVLVSCRQIHGNRVALIDEKPQRDMEVDGFDALISDRPGIGLMIQHADCQAILLSDPVKKAVGIIHAGWRGSVADIIGKTVEAMSAAFASDPAELRAAIGPSLGPCCAEFVNYQQELPVGFHRFQVRPNYFDFWEISRVQLRQAGILRNHIVAAGECTVCSSDYFSYRRDRTTGRCGTVIGLCP
jgi:YfiH family protein